MTASPTVGDALSSYFASQGLPENGGIDLTWIRFRVGPIPIAVPNFPARRLAVRYHDVHHLLTGYQTDWAGEAEIGAWEVAGGCGRYWVAWLLNSASLGFGAVLWPRRTWRAWLRGRNNGSLYREAYEPLLQERVEDLRRRLHVDDAIPGATFADGVSYAFWVLVGLTWMVLAPLALIVWIVISVWS